MSNVHPWFANVSIDIAAGWTSDFFQENNVIVAQGLANNPKMYIAETGWPTVRSILSLTDGGLTGCGRNRVMQVTQTTAPHLHPSRISRHSSIRLFVKQTRTELVTSSSK